MNNSKPQQFGYVVPHITYTGYKKYASTAMFRHFDETTIYKPIIFQSTLNVVSLKQYSATSCIW